MLCVCIHVCTHMHSVQVLPGYTSVGRQQHPVGRHVPPLSSVISVSDDHADGEVL